MGAVVYKWFMFLLCIVILNHHCKSSRVVTVMIVAKDELW